MAGAAGVAVGVLVTGDFVGAVREGGGGWRAGAGAGESGRLAMGVGWGDGDVEGVGR